jgi:hypothetical protein
MSQGGPNAPLLAALGASAYREFSRRDPGWTLQHRHPDGAKWLVIGALPHEGPGEGGGEGVRRGGLRSGRGSPRAAHEDACRLTG